VTRNSLKYFFVAMLVSVAPAAALGAGKTTKQAPAPKHADVANRHADLEKRVDEYKDALRTLIPLREKAVAAQTERVAKVKALVESGLVARKDVDEAETALATLQSDLAASQKELAGADGILEEAAEADQLASAPLPRGGYLATPAVIRYSGGGWRLADIGRVQMFYASHFGHAIPISAFGQTALHDRLGFDHSNSVDVPVRPDSVEGQALISYLRGANIPFLAFRSAIPGKATGPHIHIGFPSHRFR
jgi:hypothetical protein